MLSSDVQISNNVIVVNSEAIFIISGSCDDFYEIVRNGPVYIDGNYGYHGGIYRATAQQSFQYFSVRTFGNTMSASAVEASFQELESLKLYGGDLEDWFAITGDSLPGALTLDGGAGSDHLQAAFGTSTSFIVSADGSISSNQGLFANFETFTFLGSTEDDIFVTGAGSDLVDGYAGNDIMTGGFDGDVLIGDSGSGVELIIFSTDVRNNFNGDGRDDILWRSDSGGLSNWLGTLNGGFTNNDPNAAATVPTNWHIQPEAYIL